MKSYNSYNSYNGYNKSRGYYKKGYYNNKSRYNQNKNRQVDENQTQNADQKEKSTQNINQGNKRPYTGQNKYKKKNIQKIDHYTAQMILYRAEMYIILRYPHLLDINDKNAGIISELKENSNFFIIKSFSEEDIHKAIKYNLWTSTKKGNQTLNNAFKKCKENNGNVYLIFSSNRSGRYIGVARMKSEVNYNQNFPFWTQDNKWGGIFDLEWIFIKDVPLYLFKDIVIMHKEGESGSVINARDTQEVPYAEAVKMITIIQNYSHSNTILEHFEYYDIRQENYEKSNPAIMGQIKMTHTNSENK